MLSLMRHDLTAPVSSFFSTYFRLHLLASVGMHSTAPLLSG